ncbi:hypothetical protein K461DRAFT_268956 [Myriangium duriaei CBS 260.36]|uniref:Dynactin subunit 2 n=1 Tax=Myriangium duriaei CBS 260.36 TaxID=1168546 RepID=A0A9P4IXR7_9PEZI|nr:hypothetical protein K461DRAFT_268956 [Myriangium duriaei CBS 260.36]
MSPYCTDRFDDAPDIYESAEPADSAEQDGSAASQSASDSDDQTDPANTGISRTRLRPDQARDRFDTSRVDASKADFSDRVNAQKQTYIVSTRRRRKNRGPLIENDTSANEEGESSEDDTDESLARRIARINREIEEVRSALQRRDQAEPDGTPIDAQEKHGSSSPGEADITSLTRALSSLQTTQQQALSAHAQLSAHLFHPFVPRASSTSQETPTHSAPTEIDTTTLSRLATFDERLASLESSLGLDTSDKSPPPLIPTLTLLDKQLSLLTSPDAVPDLQAKLTSLRALTAAEPKQDPTATTEAEAPIAPHDLAQLRALYALLPTLQTLAPTVPLVLDRLRTLRGLHADAAGAKGMMDELDRRQGETEREIKAWREGLVAVEKAVVRAEEGFKVNVGEVEGWVRGLEERLKKNES